MFDAGLFGLPGFSFPLVLAYFTVVVVDFHCLIFLIFSSTNHQKFDRFVNHLFINIVSASPSTIIDPVDVERVVSTILKRHSERTSRLGIAEVEAKAVCRLAEDESHPISLRLVSSNPT